ncbi:unnamed protein product [Sphacelaria rigidula]
MRETSPAGRGNRNMYIALLAYKTWIKLKGSVIDVTTKEKMRKYCNYRLDSAPPKAILTEFGGHVSIEEYRKDFCGIVLPSQIVQDTSPLLNIRQMAVLPLIDTNSTGSSPTSASK